MRDSTEINPAVHGGTDGETSAGASTEVNPVVHGGTDGEKSGGIPTEVNPAVRVETDGEKSGGASTKVNPAVRGETDGEKSGGAPTEVNPAVSGETDGGTSAGASATVINPETGREGTEEKPPAVTKGTVICEKYTVMTRLDVPSGEADLFLCSDGEGQLVAKIYRRKFAIKQEVVDALRGVDSPYVARVYEMGSWQGYPVEILPYCQNGSLQGKTFTEEELVSRIIPDINEGLHALHEAGIIHKDLKPSNIMLNSDGKTVSIIDFGISSVIDDGSSVLLTKTGMTPEYAAPETFRKLFLRESDYYSFGITLFELFCGYTPYDNMQPEEIERYIAVQRIPFPEEMPARLQDLISALTYSDISNRGSRYNPNRRWTYEEVRRWLDGEPLEIPGMGIGPSGEMPPFRFLGEEYTDPARLAEAFAVNWEEGKKQLFRGVVTAHFRKWSPEIAGKCQAAEEEAGRENGKDDLIYWQLLYQISPGMKGFCWKRKRYESLPAFGREVLERLWNRDKSQFGFYSGLLSQKVLSRYVGMAAPHNEKLKKAAEAIEDSYVLEKNNGTDLMHTFYLMAYTLSGQKLLLLDGEQFRTVGELADYMKSVLAESTGKFEALCHRLVDYDGNLDCQLETWLLAIGKREELEIWRASMNE